MSYTKYYLYKKQYSTDSGQTWHDVVPEETVPSGDPVGHYSTLEECEAGEPIYRWIDLDPTTDYYCSGTTKMYKQQKQYSTDSGQTWHNVEPAEYREGGVAETESTDCGYVPPTGNTKFSAVYSNGDTYELQCNGNTRLYITETQPSGYDYTAMESAVVGGCVDTLGGSAFYGCTSLTAITIPNTVTTIEDGALVSLGVFKNCTALANIDLPDSITYIGSRCFEGCTAIRNFTIPSGVTTIGDSAFGGCSRLRSITIPNNVTSLGKNAFNGCSMLSAATVGDGIVKINEGCFANCTNLQSVNLSTKIEELDMSAFANCTSLLSVDFHNSLAKISHNCFEGCTSLSSVTIPDSTTYIEFSAFSGCSSLSSVTIGSGITRIGGWAFLGCGNLSDITIMAVLPPLLENTQVFDTNCPLYVQDASVEDYKLEWTQYTDRIKPLSEKP